MSQTSTNSEGVIEGHKLYIYSIVNNWKEQQEKIEINQRYEIETIIIQHNKKMNIGLETISYQFLFAKRVAPISISYTSLTPFICFYIAR